MGSDAQQVKVVTYLMERRLRVVKADTATAQFAAKGSEPQPYDVRWNGSFWSCTCASRKEECVHVMAAKTIYPTIADHTVLAAKADPEIDALLA